MKELFDHVSIRCSRLTTRAYSTSFTLGIRCLDPRIQDPIFAIYGFVRFADEIVDTFHDYNKEELLQRFRKDTFSAIADGISLNPILHSFQATVNQYQIEHALIDRFLQSMEMDLHYQKHDEESFRDYILGSAEVVGLMCLTVFCENDRTLYDKLKPYAMSLGAAFQKINFLRDMNADFVGLGRLYFPGVDMSQFNDETKAAIEKSIHGDFEHAYIGIKQLPRCARLGVYVAYVYYLALFKKIRNTPSQKVLKARIRIPNPHKAQLLAYSYFKHQLNLI
ncbi:MAG TPA: phytoene/squalene synthase family protein [Ohtaekwangia sp.]|nr:phytoene/squalene synthase family protein [Ohtaekwangia sp.]